MYNQKEDSSTFITKCSHIEESRIAGINRIKKVAIQKNVKEVTIRCNITSIMKYNLSIIAFQQLLKLPIIKYNCH